MYWLMMELLSLKLMISIIRRFLISGDKDSANRAESKANNKVFAFFPEVKPIFAKQIGANRAPR